MRSKLLRFILLPLFTLSVSSCQENVDPEIMRYINSLSIDAARINLVEAVISYEEIVFGESGEGTNSVTITLHYDNNNVENNVYTMQRVTTGRLLAGYQEESLSVSLSYSGNYVKVSNGVSSVVTPESAIVTFESIFMAGLDEDLNQPYIIEGGYYYGDYLLRSTAYSQFMRLDEDGDGLTYDTGMLAVMDPDRQKVVGNAVINLHTDHFGMLTRVDNSAQSYNGNKLKDTSTVALTGTYIYR